MSPGNADCEFSPLEIDENMTIKRMTNNYINENGKKLLQCAREGDSTAVVELLGRGAPMATDWLGTSPLHLAVMNNHYETCEILLKAGINRDVRTKVDRTPLHFAAYDGLTRIAKLLLMYGADVDCRDMLQMTPLHWAVERGHKECIKVLLNYGANPKNVSRFNKTPLSIAMDMRWEEIVEFLQKPRLVIPEESANGETTTAAPVDVQLKFPTLSKFSFEYDEDILNLNSDKPVSDNHIHEIENDSLDTEKDAQTVLESLLPQVDESPSEATLQLLKEHGITMLPADNTNTVNSALQSGRKIVLSDAGKLVLNDVTLQKDPPKPIEIKKKSIIHPTTKMKATPIYTINGNQFVAVSNQAKPNILQKLATESSAKKSPSMPGMNYVQLQKAPIKLTPWNNVKIVNTSPIKTINAAVLKNNNACFKTLSTKTIKSAGGGMYKLSPKGTKIIKLQGDSRIGGALKIIVNKNNSLPVLETGNSNNNNNIKDVITTNIVVDQSNTANHRPKNTSEVERLRAELQSANDKIEYYRRKLEEMEAELAIYKNRNCHSLMEIESSPID